MHLSLKEKIKVLLQKLLLITLSVFIFYNELNEFLYNTIFLMYSIDYTDKTSNNLK